jgi:hypothetical protein
MSQEGKVLKREDVARGRDIDIARGNDVARGKEIPVRGEGIRRKVDVGEG